MIDIYLASPYSDPSPATREARAKAAALAAALISSYGWAVYSPIVHGHALVASGASCVGTSWQDWAAIDQKFIDASREVWVLALPGWTESVGVQAEIAYAHYHEKFLRIVQPDELTNVLAERVGV